MQEANTALAEVSTEGETLRFGLQALLTLNLLNSAVLVLTSSAATIPEDCLKIRKVVLWSFPENILAAETKLSNGFVKMKPKPIVRTQSNGQV